LIGESAVVIAPIMATSIIAAGNVKGDIIGTQRIELLSSAKVTAPNLVVHKGAMFEGRCAMQPEGPGEDRKVTVFATDEHTATHSFGFIWISSSNEMPADFGNQRIKRDAVPKATLWMKALKNAPKGFLSYALKRFADIVGLMQPNT
jgi:Polymer-forming cytoskeletal